MMAGSHDRYKATPAHAPLLLEWMATLPDGMVKAAKEARQIAESGVLRVGSRSAQNTF